MRGDGVGNPIEADIPSPTFPCEGCTPGRGGMSERVRGSPWERVPIQIQREGAGGEIA